MNYLETWAKSVLALPAGTLRGSVTVEGVRDAHLGPRCEFAKVTVQFDPSNAFEVRFELGDKQEGLDKAGYLTATVMGVLDVILLTPANPLKNVRITIVAVEESEIDSSQRAFRLAGRDAGNKLLEKIKAM